MTTTDNSTLDKPDHSMPQPSPDLTRLATSLPLVDPRKAASLGFAWVWALLLPASASRERYTCALWKQGQTGAVRGVMGYRVVTQASLGPPELGFDLA